MPDVGSEGKEVVDEEQEMKYAIGVVIDRDLFPDKLFAPRRLDPTWPDARRHSTRSSTTSELRLGDLQPGHADAPRRDPGKHCSCSIPLMAVLLFLRSARTRGIGVRLVCPDVQPPFVGPVFFGRQHHPGAASGGRRLRTSCSTICLLLPGAGMVIGLGCSSSWRGAVLDCADVAPPPSSCYWPRLLHPDCKDSPLDAGRSHLPTSFATTVLATPMVGLLCSRAVRGGCQAVNDPHSISTFLILFVIDSAFRQACTGSRAGSARSGSRP